MMVGEEEEKRVEDEEVDLEERKRGGVKCRRREKEGEGSTQ